MDICRNDVCFRRCGLCCFFAIGLVYACEGFAAMEWALGICSFGITSLVSVIRFLESWVCDC